MKTTVLEFFNVFSFKFLSKTEIGHNEIHENIIYKDINEPVPEYDTAIEHEESNKEEVTKIRLNEQEDYLDLKETDKDTHKIDENVQPEDGRLRPHNRIFLGSKGFRRY